MKDGKNIMKSNEAQSTLQLLICIDCLPAVLTEAAMPRVGLKSDGVTPVTQKPKCPQGKGQTDRSARQPPTLKWSIGEGERSDRLQ